MSPAATRPPRQARRRPPPADARALQARQAVLEARLAQDLNELQRISDEIQAFLYPEDLARGDREGHDAGELRALVWPAPTLAGLHEAAAREDPAEPGGFDPSAGKPIAARQAHAGPLAISSWDDADHEGDTADDEEDLEADEAEHDHLFRQRVAWQDTREARQTGQAAAVAATLLKRLDHVRRRGGN